MLSLYRNNNHALLADADWLNFSEMKSAKAIITFLFLLLTFIGLDNTCVLLTICCHFLEKQAQAIFSPLLSCQSEVDNATLYSIWA